MATSVFRKCACVGGLKVMFTMFNIIFKAMNIIYCFAVHSNSNSTVVHSLDKIQIAVFPVS